MAQLPLSIVRAHFERPKPDELVSEHASCLHRIDRAFSLRSGFRRVPGSRPRRRASAGNERIQCVRLTLLLPVALLTWGVELWGMELTNHRRRTAQMMQTSDPLENHRTRRSRYPNHDLANSQTSRLGRDTSPSTVQPLVRALPRPLPHPLPLLPPPPQHTQPGI